MRKCSRCGKKKAEKDFPFRNKAKGIRRGTCKECCRVSIRKHYQENKDVYKKKARAHNKKREKVLREIIYDYLKAKCCVDCGEDNPIVLDFDHVRGTKKSNISDLIKLVVSTETLFAEIAKCDIRCSNCHRKKTAKERKNYRYLRQQRDKRKKKK